MGRVVVAGCGYVGEPLADALHSEGWHVEAWTGSAESVARLADKPYGVICRDISQPQARAVPAHLVVQCVSTRGGDAEAYERLYFQGARNLAAAFPSATLLFTSSTGVYAQLNGELVTEESAAEPTRESAWVLRRTEDFVLARGGIVARLAAIYGPQRSAWLRKFLRREPIARPVEDYYVNQIHRDDVVSALRLLIARRAAIPGQIFNVVDNDPITSRACYEILATLLDRPLPETATIPPQRRRGLTNKRVSNVKLRQLGWHPRFPTFEVGLRESVLRPCPPQVGYESC